MPRTARIVAPGVPHHIIQRGNRRQPVFFNDGDYKLYRDLMAEWCEKGGVEVWAYCLMTNHIHLIAAPADKSGLAWAVGEAHRRYTRAINLREGWTGHLWQGRFASFPMDEVYTLAAARYIERNPVAAGMVKHAEEYQWSSAASLIKGCDDGLVRTRPLLDYIDDWRSFLSVADDDGLGECLDSHGRSGWPLGCSTFIDGLEAMLGRKMIPKPRGRPRKAREAR